MVDANEVIAALDLRPLPREGGYYRETYRSELRLPSGLFGQATEKSLATAIYYLLTPDSFSALHRLPADELFHFYLGDPVLMLQLDPEGGGRVVTLGTDLASGQAPQALVPRGVWQGSCLAGGGKFALLGTTMSPGFDFADYEPGERALLKSRYPAFAQWIDCLTSAG